jgi:hypothetical protein
MKESPNDRLDEPCRVCRNRWFSDKETPCNVCSYTVISYETSDNYGNHFIYMHDTHPRKKRIV